VGLTMKASCGSLTISELGRLGSVLFVRFGWARGTERVLLTLREISSLRSSSVGLELPVLVSSVPKAAQRALAFFQPRPELT